MYLCGADREMIEQGSTCHSQIAPWILRRHQPFVAEEKLYASPIDAVAMLGGEISI
jgi:hypothetical protein